MLYETKTVALSYARKVTSRSSSSNSVDN